MNSLTFQTRMQTLPPDLRSEVMDFIDFLIEKSTKKKKKTIPKFGCLKGRIKISSDFDAPLEDFKEYM